MSERTVSTAQRGRMLASTIGKPVLFFGTSCAGAAHVLGAERFCPMSA